MKKYIRKAILWIKFKYYHARYERSRDDLKQLWYHSLAKECYCKLMTI